MSDPTSLFWADLRRSTQARIGLGRAGDALPTTRVLEARQAHAVARDAVHDPLDAHAACAALEALGLGTPTVVRSRASDRAQYLRRPDLGRLPLDLADLPAAPPGGVDIGIVLADGLCARAAQTHGPAMVKALVDALDGALTVAAPVVALQARVALGDHIGLALGVRTLIVLIGERPGLSVADSLGAYLTHLPRPGLTDADRNCVSNIHPPDGLGYQAAAHVVASLVGGARALGRSGVDLKDTSRERELDGAPAASGAAIGGATVQGGVDEAEG